MKLLLQLALELLCVGLLAGVCTGQVPLQAGAATGNETNNIVQGKVVQEGGQGIRKVKVSLRRISGPRPGDYETITDETGHFEIEAVEPGEYAVQLERAGFAADAKRYRDRIINVTAGEGAKDLVFHMQMAGLIVGRLLIWTVSLCDM